MAKEYFAHSSLLPFYIDWQVQPTSANYNLSFYYPLKTQYETNVLIESLQKVIALSPHLRQTFCIKKKKLTATIHDELPANINFFNSTFEDLAELLNNLAKMPHDLNNRSSINLNIIKLKEHYIALFNIHHMIMDGIGLDKFICDLNKLISNDQIDIVSPEQYITAIKNEDPSSRKLNQKQKDYIERVNQTSQKLNYPKVNSGTSIDITERKKMEEELRQAKEAAEAASLAKTAFIANMSHDIRTPLAGVIGMADMLALNLNDPERKQEAMLLSRSGNQLLNMLNEILDTVRAGNASEVDIQEETFDVYQCVQGLIELESPTTAAKHLGLQCEIDVNVPQYIVGDRKKIHHVLLNLLGNATKFTKIGGITIEIHCLERTSSHVHLQFAVADTGIGIPKKLQKKVFERFFRIDPSYKGQYEGYGLGLNIAQSYVNLLGGHLSLTSKEGVGTTFHFDLQCKIGNKEDVIHNGCIETTVNLAHAPHPSDLSYSINGKTPHLLLVEDNDVALKILESIVANAGCHFTSASDGESALELAKSIKFDLILTDIGLPGISGTELAAQIRIFEKIMNKSPVPIVGLTGHLQETAKPECMDCGMNDVFTKPINRSTMQMIIKTFVLHLLSDERQNHLKTKTANASTGKLGLDLPDTTEELFDLDDFPIFNPQDGLQYANLTVLINLLRIFISDEMQKDIHKMEQAYLEKNWAQVEALAHKLKGGVASIGLNRMRYACQYFERYYKTKQCMLLDKLYHQIIAVNDETVETIQKWLENYGLK